MSAAGATRPLPRLAPSARLALLALVALGAVTAAGLWLSAGGDEPATAGPLGWTGEAIVFEHETLRGDWIASGEVRNGGGEPLRLVATKDVRVVDSGGDALPSSAVFSKTVGHGLFNPTRLPDAKLPEGELRRIGDVAYIEPGKSVPLTVSWRDGSGEREAVAVEYPGGHFPLPAGD